MKRRTSWPLFLTLMVICATATAFPAVQTASDTDDDATITLRVLSKAIELDGKSWCELRFVDANSDVTFSAGDRVEIWVYEDDLAGDDLIWSTTIDVTGSGRIDRTFDCSSVFPDDDTGDFMEIYAQATVTKDDCGFGCLYDRPETANIDVEIVNDDAKEPNDTNAQPTGLALGRNADLISRDQDWFSVTLSQPSRITLDMEYRTNVGRVDMTAFNASQSQLSVVADSDAGGSLVIERAEPGMVFFRTSPRVSNDFNFYELLLTVDTLAADCVTGTTENRVCGNCGSQTRTCDPNGRWGPYGECGGEGVCAPGEEMTSGCGNCGTAVATCSDTCQWGNPGACTMEGECAPGAVEETNCTGGTQQRMCADDCAWGDFTACGMVVCMDNESEPCYGGPDETRGVGACTDGMRRCSNNAWGQCRNDVRPSVEVCADNIDNDCDGQVDAADTDCADNGRPLGDPCGSDADCKSMLECVRPPQDPAFEGGYCGKGDCSGDADCGSDGFCGLSFDANYCFKRCSTTGDCRDGYLCLDIGGRDGCVPRCRADNHCRDAGQVCNPDTGQCEPIPANNGVNNGGNNGAGNNGAGNNGAGNNGAGNNGAGNNGTNNGTTGATPAPPAGEEACGCRTPASNVPVSPLALLALVALIGGALTLRR